MIGSSFLQVNSDGTSNLSLTAPYNDDQVVPKFYVDNKVNSFSVRSYGAKGDGITDDSAAITAMFNAISANGGGLGYFPKGVYLSTTEQLVPSNTILYGDGYSSVIKRGTGSINYLVNVLKINSENNIRITNLQIDGQKSDIIANYDNAAQHGPYVYVTCNGVYITGTSVAPSTNITIDHCYIHDSYFGNICPDYADKVDIEANYIYNGRDNQINGRPGVLSHITVKGNIVTGVGPVTTATQYSGIQFIRGTYITISGNICYGFGNTVSTEGNGIGLEGSRHVSISDNICTHNLSQGIKIDYTVEGNPVAWDGIDSYVPNDCVSYLNHNFVSITYNTNQTPPSTASSNSNWTYQASGPYNQNSVDVVIVGNTCSDNNYFNTYSLNTSGIYVNRSESVIVNSNLMYGNYRGFNQGQNCTDLVIKDNQIYNNQAQGIAFFNNLNGYGPFIIEGNIVSRNGAKGIDVVVPCTIKNNICQSNALAGISLSITGTVVQANPFFLVDGNIGIDNGDDAILVGGGFSSTVPVEIRGNYAPKSTIQPRFLGENGTPVRCVNNRVDTQKTELWYFTNAGSIWTDENNLQIVTVTSNYSVGVLDSVILVNPASNTIVTLPAPNSTHPPGNPGRTVTVTKTNSSANTVIVATAGGSINASTTIANTSSQRYISDGTNWNAA